MGFGTSDLGFREGVPLPGTSIDRDFAQTILKYLYRSKMKLTDETFSGGMG